jgi:hypothetical protein
MKRQPKTQVQNMPKALEKSTVMPDTAGSHRPDGTVTHRVSTPDEIAVDSRRE